MKRRTKRSKRQRVDLLITNDMDELLLVFVEPLCDEYYLTHGESLTLTADVSQGEAVEVMRHDKPFVTVWLGDAVGHVATSSLAGAVQSGYQQPSSDPPL